MHKMTILNQTGPNKINSCVKFFISYYLLLISLVIIFPFLQDTIECYLSLLVKMILKYCDSSKTFNKINCNKHLMKLLLVRLAKF